MFRDLVPYLRISPATWLGLAAALVLVSPPAHAGIVGIQGTMSNFDVFNETGSPVYGAELDLEGCTPDQVTKTYPSHFTSMTALPYTEASKSGTRLTFTGYTFNLPNDFIIPTVGISTNGHYAVNVQGAEHFGFSVAAQPTATRFFWLDQSSARISNIPLSIPAPTWTYVPPAVPGAQPIVQVVVQPPEPVEVQPQLPDSIWMKVYVTEHDHQVDLMELISQPYDANGVVPQEPAEVETEWELLEGGKMSQGDVPISEKGVSVVRRYEFFQYTGAYDPEDHAPLSTWNGVGDPPADEFGQFIAANMAAINFEVPEPSTLLLCLPALALLARARRHRAI